MKALVAEGGSLNKVALLEPYWPAETAMAARQEDLRTCYLKQILVFAPLH